MGCGQADQCAASVRVEVGCPLAHEIWRPQKSLAAGWSLGSLGGKAFIRIAAVVITAIGGACAELIAKPAQGKPGSLSYAHDVPAARNRVTKGMKPALGFERRTICGGKDHAGSAD